jgi:hypothetical protein
MTAVDPAIPPRHAAQRITVDGSAFRTAQVTHALGIAVLPLIGTVAAVMFARANGVTVPALDTEKIDEGTALSWNKASQAQPQLVTLEPTKTERRRHLRKYAEGSLGEDKSFYFRGPEGKLKLRAYNLIVFNDLADGVDDDTWLHHWKRGEISAWVRTCIKDEPLAEQITSLEHEVPDDADESRKRVRELIEQTYTLPAEANTRTSLAPPT